MKIVVRGYQQGKKWVMSQTWKVIKAWGYVEG